MARPLDTNFPVIIGKGLCHRPQLTWRVGSQAGRGYSITPFGSARDGKPRSFLLCFSSYTLSRFAFDHWSSPSQRRSEEHTSELQSQSNLVCRLLLEKKKKQTTRPVRWHSS